MLYQYHGNDMEALRDAACTLLGAAPAPPLVAERLIVPNVGMAKWLRQGIAARLGVAANLRNESPAVFLTRWRARCWTMRSRRAPPPGARSSSRSG
jgi:exonuclease V gamma subunit